MPVSLRMMRCVRMAITLLVLSIPVVPHAQDAAAPSRVETGSADSIKKTGETRARSDSATPSPAAAELHRLPPDSTTKQTLVLPGRTLAFTATAGSIRQFDDKGEPLADIAYTAYMLDGANTRTRPVTFVFNGGPGASSAWLQFGSMGPWRIDIDANAVSPSSAADVLPNAETWLDFTDLVFIDPVITGYSRFVTPNEEARKRLLSVDGDVQSLALTIRRWLEKSDRLLSPKFIVGESYGGIRGPKVVRNLQTDQGVGVKGLILVSPALDFRELFGGGLMQYVASLPTMAAVAREKECKGGVTRAGMADVEEYARGEFLTDLVKGQADPDAPKRLADRVAALTGIDQSVSRKLSGRLDVGKFRREFAQRNGSVTGRYDASVEGFDPYSDSGSGSFGDPSGDSLLAPLTSAAVEVTTRRLNWRPDGSYELLNGAVSGRWDYGRGRSFTESVSQLREILSLDAKLKVLVAHGLFDLATPYFGSKLILDQLPSYGSPDRVKLVVYPGGHMFYSRDASRQALRAEAERILR